MINADQLASEMQQVLYVCPPYVSPGSTSFSAILSGEGCDCSGVPYAIFKSHKLDLYHGSNTIARKYMQTLHELSSDRQLEIGDAVFKWSPSGTEPSKYRQDGLGDFHHIGIVTLTNPLRIVHQSSAAGHTAVDSSISKWQYYGKLKGVSYDSSEKTEEVENGMYKVEVIPSSLRIREEPSTKANVLGSLPRGSKVTCAGIQNGWYKLATAEGWISADYCKVLQQSAYIGDDDEKNDEKTDEKSDAPGYEERLNELQDAAVDAKTHYEANAMSILQLRAEIAELRNELEKLRGD